MQQYAGVMAMCKLAREDARRELQKLIEGPRGTHAGKGTPDSVAYVAELQRMLALIIPRVR